jgi:hypothetical protein
MLNNQVHTVTRPQGQQGHHGADPAGGKDLSGREKEIGVVGKPALTIHKIRREAQGGGMNSMV